MQAPRAIAPPVAAPEAAQAAPKKTAKAAPAAKAAAAPKAAESAPSAQPLDKKGLAQASTDRKSATLAAARAKAQAQAALGTKK
jgi:hypothetical protein